MTIAIETVKVIYTGDSSADEFDFTFAVSDESEITVYLQTIATNEVEGPLDEALYSVALNEDGTGTVTYPLVGSPIANTTKIALVRSGLATQELDIMNQGGFHPESVEEELDKLTMRVQELKEWLARTLYVDVFTEAPEVSEVLAQIELVEDAAADVVADVAAAEAAAAAAALSETAAEGYAGAAAASVAGMPFIFASSTVDSDPGAGTFRLDHGTASSATGAYIDNTDNDGVSQSGVIDTWDDSTNTTNKGRLSIRSTTNPAVRHTYKVTGSVLDGTGYRKVTLTWLDGAGAFTPGEECVLLFTPAGDKGVDGAGAGDVVGPASSTDNGFVRYDGTTGKLVKNGAATIATADIGDAQVTAAKIENQTANSVFGRASNSSGVPAPIVAGTNDRILAQTSNALSWVQLTIGMIPDALITFAKMATAAIATTGELLAGTANKILTAEILKNAVAYQTLTDAATVAWNMASGNNALVVLGGNRTLGNPTNPIPLFGFVLKVTATGSTRTLSLGTNWVKGTAVESFPISITTSETVYIHGFVDTSTRIIITGVTRT